uniref:AAA family ATPase n=1 Tax=Paractinoplanes polyasparticus TaxID=2856853 RepID=UPI001C84B91E|nr:AAA family ATPase [Actinoplanes polyasparticus]
MRLNKLHIGDFKNLRDFEVMFDEVSPYTVLVGENGAGKSNLLEAITLIFRNLDLDIEAPFAYQLWYECRGTQLRVDAEANRIPKFSILRGPTLTDPDGVYEELPRRRFMENASDGAPKYRPAFVFGYYSGPSDRLSSLYEKHRERYYNFIIKAREQRTRALTDPNALRRLFYAENLHGQFALIAFFMDSTESARSDREFLREFLQIEGLDSVLFALKRPPWRRKGGDQRFWNAVGEVRDFLSNLYETALLPLRMERRISVDLTKNPSVESLYLFLPSAVSLEAVYQKYANQYAFFSALESTHLSKLLAEVRTRIRMTADAGGGEVTYRDLSEGEQQLLLVLGLLKFTARAEALFLLDEPDTHLNPAWSTQYLDFLDRFIADRDSCHILMTTHDPLVFSRLTRAQVRLFGRNDTGWAWADEPLNDPRGMGIQAILASDLFRLRSGGLDADTLRLLDQQHQLSTRDDLTPAEESLLRRVTDELNELDFWKSDRDPVYQAFLQRFIPAWTARNPMRETDLNVQLSSAQLEAREALAAEIAEEIAAEMAAERRI